jgi:pimeloyl-ACP methyl ester carboxylesterase
MSGRALRIAKWLVSAVLALSLLLLVAGNLFGQYLLRYTREHFPPPGKLIALEGHRLHLHCTGQGSPTVLLESGSASWSTQWTMVQTKVAAFTRVCSYDRASLGWSDPGQRPQDIRSSVRDLGELLTRSGETGPFVFAGWSFGGSIAWLYVQDHLEQSAGLVMVDARSEGWQTWMNGFAPELKAGREKLATQLRGVDSLGLGPAYSWLLLRGSGNDSIKGFPPGTGDVLLDPGFTARMFGGKADVLNADDISERQIQMRPLGNLPLIVIPHGREGMFGLAPDRERVAEMRWQEMQWQLTKQSTDAKFEVAEMSGHGVPLEQPDIVVEAIQELVTKWRAKRDESKPSQTLELDIQR